MTLWERWAGSGRDEGVEQHDRLYRDFDALQERLSRLSQASLRIYESLEFGCRPLPSRFRPFCGAHVSNR